MNGVVFIGRCTFKQVLFAETQLNCKRSLYDLMQCECVCVVGSVAMIFNNYHHGNGAVQNSQLLQTIFANK